MNSMTKAEMQAEIDRLKAKVAELEGEVNGLKFALKHQPLPQPSPGTDWNPYAWTWPSQVKPVWEVAPDSQPYKVIC